MSGTQIPLGSVESTALTAAFVLVTKRLSTISLAAIVVSCSSTAIACSAPSTPPGTVLVRTSDDDDRIYYPRFSRSGDRIAFWKGTEIAAVDLAGHETALAKGYDIPLGISWSAAGGEIWFGGLKLGAGPTGWAIYAVTPSGRQRVVLARRWPAHA